MPFSIWSLDIAREQSPTLDHLFQYASLTQEAGYDALGLYLEHRFAWECAPWANGTGAVNRHSIERLQEEFPSLQIIPMINLLGHFEGFIYTEEGKQFREARFVGLQACPCAPGFRSLCEAMIDETLSVFRSTIVHIGADEAASFGQCEACKRRISELGENGKAKLFAEHYVPLVQRVIDAGRRPAIWADVFKDHPEILEMFPKQTLLFDWNYHAGIGESASKLKASGFDVIGCPTLQVWNAPWLHIDESEQNIREIARDVKDQELAGFCLSTWECGLFGAYDTLFPAIKWAAKVAENPEFDQSLRESYSAESDDQGSWAKMIGQDLAELGGVFGHSPIRSSMKCRLLLYGNPFLLWMHHGAELAGDQGKEALAILERALFIAPTETEKGVTLFIRGAVEFCRLAEEARLQYEQRQPDAAIGKLAPARYLFETLEAVAKRSVDRIGGSRADMERCVAARRHLETVFLRLRKYGRGELGYLPSFESITNPRFMPHDQGNWWLINKWANE